MSVALHPAVAELLASRRLGPLEQGSSRHRFTVSREAGLMRLREQARERNDATWAWTLFVLRAANAVSGQAEAQVGIEQLEGKDETLEQLPLDVITPGFELDGLDLSDLLAGALAPDIGLPLSLSEGDEDQGEADEGETELDEGERLARREHERGLRLARFRALIGRALNLALLRVCCALSR